MKKLAKILSIVLALILSVFAFACSSTSTNNVDDYELFIRYSANADGEGFTQEFVTGESEYIGFAMAETAPTDKAKYTWLAISELGINTNGSQIGGAGSGTAGGSSGGSQVGGGETNGGNQVGGGTSSGGNVTGGGTTDNSGNSSGGTSGNPGISGDGNTGSGSSSGGSSGSVGGSTGSGVVAPTQLYIKYSANADGSNATDTWSEGQNYIGVAISEAEPQLSEYKWAKFMDNKPVEQPVEKNIKLLLIGNSYSDDAAAQLWEIFKDAGYKNVKIGIAYKGGCTLEQHWQFISENSKYEEYHENVDGTWTSQKNAFTLGEIIKSDTWDVITLQESSGPSGQPEKYVNLQNIINYVLANKTNANAKLLWHMTWAYQVDYEGNADGRFANYNYDQMNMYNKIVETVKNKVLTCNGIDGIIPSGTTFQNLRTSKIGDTLQRDVCHASYDVGRYALALTYFASITGESIDDINYLPDHLVDFYYYGTIATHYDVAITNKVAENLVAIKEAVNNAIKNPYQVTNCKGNVAPVKYLTLTENDKQFLTDIGRNPSDFLKVDLEWTVGGFYNAASNDNTTDMISDLISKPVTTSSISANFSYSRIFTKEDLPVGTVMLLQQGYRFMPEGWYALNEKLPNGDARATLVSADSSYKVITVDEAFVKAFNFRAFNLATVSADRPATADDQANLVVYVPRSALRG